MSQAHAAMTTDVWECEPVYGYCSLTLRPIIADIGVFAWRGWIVGFAMMTSGCIPLEGLLTQWTAGFAAPSCPDDAVAQIVAIDDSDFGIPDQDVSACGHSVTIHRSFETEFQRQLILAAEQAPAEYPYFATDPGRPLCSSFGCSGVVTSLTRETLQGFVDESKMLAMATFILVPNSSLVYSAEVEQLPENDDNQASYRVHLRLDTTRVVPTIYRFLGIVDPRPADLLILERDVEFDSTGAIIEIHDSGGQIAVD